MKKADQKKLSETLDKALAAPPRRMPKQALDSLLNEYDDTESKRSPVITAVPQYCGTAVPEQDNESIAPITQVNENKATKYTGVPEYRSTAAENTGVLESKITGELNTNIKDKNYDDDAALAGLITELKSANIELTGKEISIAENDRWRELAQVITAELKIAAARTTISSVPAFLAEHLRRRLWKIDKKQARAEGRELPDESVNQTSSVDANKCPDCGGSGWWYPEGEIKGVARCKHEKLTLGS